MGEFVRLEVEDGVGIIRLDRPPANAIDLQVGLELQDAIHEAEASERVGAIVVWGGPRIFAAGADIKPMAEWGPEEVRPSVDALGDAADLLERIPKVSIAAVNGYALGGGLELALGCDLRYLAEDASVGQPEIRLGVIPGAGGTQRLTQLIGPGLTRRLVYTGEQVDAAAAERLGIAERVLPADDVLPQAVAGRPGHRRGAEAGDRGRQDRDPRGDRDAGPRRDPPGAGAVPRPLRERTTSAKGCGPSWRNGSPGSADRRVRVTLPRYRSQGTSALRTGGMNRSPRRFEDGTRDPSCSRGPWKGCDGMSDDRFKGAAVRTLPRANRTYSSGRVCAQPGCETKLSMYNKWQYCWQHEPVHAYIPRGKRRSKKRAA